MKLSRHPIWVLAFVACSTAPTAPTEPAGFHVQVEPNAEVIAAGDTLLVRVTITNETPAPQNIVGVTCQAIVEVFPEATSTRLPVYDSRACIAIKGTTTVLPHGTLSDVLRFATTTTPGASNALSAGTYRVQGQFSVSGQGLVRSEFATVTVSR